MAVPWARTGSIFTRAFEDEVAWFLQKTNQAATAAYFGISWPTAGKIARRVVAEKLDGQLLENLRFLGIDEISYGRPRKFLTVVIDHQRHRVVWAGEGQSAKTLAKFFELLGPVRCSAIEGISIDIRIYANKSKSCESDRDVVLGRLTTKFITEQPDETFVGGRRVRTRPPITLRSIEPASLLR